MIRRCLSLMLALCLLLLTPLAQAEGYAAVVSWEAEEEGVRAYLTQEGYEGNDLELLTNAAVTIMNDLVIQLEAGQENFFLAAWLGDDVVFSLDIEQIESSILVRSSLLPDVALSMDMATLWQDEQQAAPYEALNQLDWDGLAENVSEVLRAWRESLYYESMDAASNPGAAEGAAQIETWQFSDADIAALLDALLDACAPVLTALGDDGANFDSALRQKNEEVAQANRYDYALFIDTDEDGQPLQYEFVTWQGYNPVFDVMLSPMRGEEGTPDYYLQVDWGWKGVPHEQQAVIAFLEDEEAGESYFNLYTTGDRTFETWGVVVGPTGEIGLETDVYLSHEDNTVAWCGYLDIYPVEEVSRIDATEGETILRADAEGNLSEADEQLLKSSATTGTTALLTTLFKKLPAELLVMLMNSEEVIP